MAKSNGVGGRSSARRRAAQVGGEAVPGNGEEVFEGGAEVRGVLEGGGGVLALVRLLKGGGWDERRSKREEPVAASREGGSVCAVVGCICVVASRFQ